MAGSASTCPAILPNQTPSLLPGEAREIVQTLTGDTAKTTGEAGGTSPRLSNSSSPTGTPYQTTGRPSPLRRSQAWFPTPRVS